MTHDFAVLAFGAKIARRRGAPPVERVMVTEPIEGGAAEVVHPIALGGTRHLSAAQFVQDQRDATAFVASQDGRFTVFAWSPCESMVSRVTSTGWICFHPAAGWNSQTP